MKKLIQVTGDRLQVTELAIYCGYRYLQPLTSNLPSGGSF